MAEAQQQSRAAVPRAPALLSHAPEAPALIRDQKRAELRAKTVAASQDLAARTEVVRDFFGRPVVPKVQMKGKAPQKKDDDTAPAAAAAPVQRAKPPVTYKFKEVRRSLSICHFDRLS